MRILHTSDWHIGRRFKGVDLSDYHQQAFDWLVDTIKREQIDVLCVSGDIYDTARPSSQQVDQFSRVINKLAHIRNHGRPLEVIITPGNHDSALRVGSFDESLLPNIHMCARVERMLEPIVIARPNCAQQEYSGSIDTHTIAHTDAEAHGTSIANTRSADSADCDSCDTYARHTTGEVMIVYALPYLHPDVARQPLAAKLRQHLQDNTLQADQLPESITVEQDGTVNIERSHESVFHALMTLLLPDIAKRRLQAAADGMVCTVVVMAHAFISGATRSEGEYPITVGGVDNVPADIFAWSGIDYVALGHLHRPQAVSIPNVPSPQLDAVRTLRDTMIRHAYGYSTATASAEYSISNAHTLPLSENDMLSQCQRTPLVRYSGSLLAYSFGEASAHPITGNHKSVVIAESCNSTHTAATDDAYQFTIIDTPYVQSGQPALVVLEGTEEHVLANADAHNDHWVAARVHYTEYPVGIYERLSHYFTHVLEKTLINDAPAQHLRSAPARQNIRGQELQIIKQFVYDMTGKSAEPREIAVLQQALDDVLQQH